MEESYVVEDDDGDDDMLLLTDEEFEKYVQQRAQQRFLELRYDTIKTYKSLVDEEEKRTNELTLLFDKIGECVAKLEKSMNEKSMNSANSQTEEIVLSDNDDDVSIVDKTQQGGKVRLDSLRPRSAGSHDAANQQQPASDHNPQTLHTAVAASSIFSQLGATRNPQMMGRVQTVLNQPSVKLMELASGMKLYAKKGDDVWYKGTLIDIMNSSKPVSERKYKIKFDGKGMKIVGSKMIASTNPLRENVPVGTRVIALYYDDTHQGLYYAGIIAEPPSIRNNNRFLVFFDDGYAQYVQVSVMRQVYDQSKQVWEDIHPDSQDFIRSYLQQYPERPMVRLQPGQVIKTEWNGNWYPARVLEVDASLVKMYFDVDGRTEWIYRGSTRLEPLYTELANAEASKLAAGSKVRRRSNLNVKALGQKRPFVEYTRGPEDDPQRKVAAVQRSQSVGSTMSSAVPAATPAAAAAPLLSDALKKQHVTARKSTGGPKPGQNGSRSSTSSVADDRSQGSVGAHDAEQIDLTLEEDTTAVSNGEPRTRAARVLRSSSSSSLAQTTNHEAHGEFVVMQGGVKDLATTMFIPHSCCHDCLRGDDNPAKYKGHNPLCIPMDFGWNRLIVRHSSSAARRTVFYITPCRRRLRNETEVDRYLLVTDSFLTVDLFCFDPDLRTDVEFKSLKKFCDIVDLSYSKENVAIPCVNELHRDYPDYVEYSNQRIPTQGVNLNLDEEFLCGCDCTDGCRDRSRCQCIRMTIEESKALPPTERPLRPGYQNRRLTKAISTGIYECNSRCKCDARCQNRVVQNGLTMRLQVFKTEKRGWGLRCLNDIPAGGFICIYAGQLLNDEGANADGKQFGDEYLAELDLIEVVEKFKEDYESEVEDPEKQSTSKGTSSESEFEPNTNRDSDSTYSGERRRYSKRTTRQTTAKKTEKVEKKTKKEAASRQTVKFKKMEVAAKMTAAWIDSITISDDERDSAHSDDQLTTEKPPADNGVDKKVYSAEPESGKLNESKDDKTALVDPKEDKSGSSRDDQIEMKGESSSDRLETVTVTAKTSSISLSVEESSDGTGTADVVTGGDALSTEAKSIDISTDIENNTSRKMEVTEGSSEHLKNEADIKCDPESKLKACTDVKDAVSVAAETMKSEAKCENDSSMDVDGTSYIAKTEVCETADIEQKFGNVASDGISEDVDMKDISATHEDVKDDHIATDGITNSVMPLLLLGDGFADLSDTNDNVEAVAKAEDADLHKPNPAAGDASNGEVKVPVDENTKSEDAADGESKPESNHVDDSSNLLITELTSLNTDNIEVESDDNDDQTTSGHSKVDEERCKKTRSSKRLANTSSQRSRFSNLPDPKSQQQVGGKNAVKTPLKPPTKSVEDKKSFVKTRALFGEEYCYIMDAKSVGNLGRYLNHSCDPNVFVQNVFVDTHDLRFPWVAFFAIHHIKAGSELTWDYNYEVGSVVDKTLYCYCGSADCRGRLL